MTNVGQMYRMPPLSAALYADMLPSQVQGNAKDFFTYGIDYLPLAASATLRGSFQVQNDSDFYILYATGTSRDTTTQALETDRAFTADLFTSGSGRLLNNRPVDFNNMFGTAQLPCFFPYPKLLERASEFTCTLANLTATARNVRINFVGFKVFDWPADRTPGGV